MPSNERGNNRGRNIGEDSAWGEVFRRWLAESLKGFKGVAVRGIKAAFNSPISALAFVYSWPTVVSLAGLDGDACAIVEGYSFMESHGLSLRLWCPFRPSMGLISEAVSPGRRGGGDQAPAPDPRGSATLFVFYGLQEVGYILGGDDHSSHCQILKVRVWGEAELPVVADSGLESNPCLSRWEWLALLCGALLDPYGL